MFKNPFRAKSKPVQGTTLADIDITKVMRQFMSVNPGSPLGERRVAAASMLRLVAAMVEARGAGVTPQDTGAVVEVAHKVAELPHNLLKNIMAENHAKGGVTIDSPPSVKEPAFVSYVRDLANIAELAGGKPLENPPLSPAATAINDAVEARLVARGPLGGGGRGPSATGAPETLPEQADRETREALGLRPRGAGLDPFNMTCDKCGEIPAEEMATIDAVACLPGSKTPIDGATITYNLCQRCAKEAVQTLEQLNAKGGMVDANHAEYGIDSDELRRQIEARKHVPRNPFVDPFQGGTPPRGEVC